jgi:hypothetical protein
MMLLRGLFLLANSRPLYGWVTGTNSVVVFTRVFELTIVVRLTGTNFSHRIQGVAIVDTLPVMSTVRIFITSQRPKVIKLKLNMNTCTPCIFAGKIAFTLSL